MGTPIVIGIAIVSGLLCFKQDIYQTWVFLVNLVFSVYIAMFMAPVFAGLIPELPYGVDTCKLPGIMFFLMFLILQLLYKLTETIAPKTHDQYQLPYLVSKVGGMFFGGLAGAVMLSFMCVCIFMMPFSEDISKVDREAFVDTSKITLALTAKSLNFFSLQGTSREADEIIKQLKPYKTK